MASTISDVAMIGTGEPERLRGNYVTMNTFDVMGVPPLIGRGSTAEDGRPGAAPIAVLGYKFWQSRFGGSRDVLGQQLRLERHRPHRGRRDAAALHVARRRCVSADHVRARAALSTACAPCTCSDV